MGGFHYDTCTINELLTSHNTLCYHSYMEELTVLAVELGDFSLGDAALIDIIWFLAGVLILTGITAFAIRYNRRSAPDPFL